MTSKELKRKAKNFRKAHKIKKATYENLNRAAFEIGYTVALFTPGANDEDVQVLIDALDLEKQTENSRGFAYADSNYRIIFINDSLSADEKAIVIAHEIGHIELGHLKTAHIIGKDVEEEHEANEFAHFLLHYTVDVKTLLIAATCTLVAFLVGTLMFFNIKNLSLKTILGKEEATQEAQVADASEETEASLEEEIVETTQVVDENGNVQIVQVMPNGSYNYNYTPPETSTYPWSIMDDPESVASMKAADESLNRYLEDRSGYNYWHSSKSEFEASAEYAYMRSKIQALGYSIISIDYGPADGGACAIFSLGNLPDLMRGDKSAHMPEWNAMINKIKPLAYDIEQYFETNGHKISYVVLCGKDNSIRECYTIQTFNGLEYNEFQ